MAREVERGDSRPDLELLARPEIRFHGLDLPFWGKTCREVSSHMTVSVWKLILCEPFFTYMPRRARGPKRASIGAGEALRHRRTRGVGKTESWMNGKGPGVGGSLAVRFDVQPAPEDHLWEGANRLITFVGESHDPSRVNHLAVA